MDKKIIKSDGNEIEEYKFHQNKSPISINDIDINKVVVSNNLSFVKQVFKYFIGYQVAKENKPLSIFRPKMSVYKRGLIKLDVCIYQ